MAKLPGDVVECHEMTGDHPLMIRRLDVDETTWRPSGDWTLSVDTVP